MTSLPIVIPNPSSFASMPGSGVGKEEREDREERSEAREETIKKENEKEQFLLRAFRSFAEASSSLERSYAMLRSEVERLHADLAQSHAGLERSLDENRRMRRHLDRILDGLPCGVLVVEAQGKISLVNPEGRRLLRALDPAAGEDRTSVPSTLCPLLDRARSGGREQEQCFQNERGGEFWLAARHAAFEDVDENADYDTQSIRGDCSSIFILRDASDAKRLVREREKLRREQALAEMAAILAHEIRNPLGSLELFAGLLAGAGLAPECQQWVEQVQAGLRTLAATVNNVLHFHSLPPPARVPTELGGLLDWAGGFLVPVARRARVELCLRNRLAGVWFAADRHRLEQVLLNLVLNALQAMPGGGWVEISGHKIHRSDASAAAICVTDTGPGIRPEQFEKIFAPGFSTRAGSPGLGLAVCRKIVEQHGGRLEAGNRAGAGARFRLTFPLLENMPENTVEGTSEGTLEETQEEMPRELLQPGPRPEVAE